MYPKHPLRNLIGYGYTTERLCETYNKCLTQEKLKGPMATNGGLVHSMMLELKPDPTFAQAVERNLRSFACNMRASHVLSEARAA